MVNLASDELVPVWSKRGIVVLARYFCLARHSGNHSSSLASFYISFLIIYTQVLIYLDAHCEVGINWYAPLVAPISKDRYVMLSHLELWLCVSLIHV